MDRTSRTELIRTIETQKEKLQRYESRLKDVVAAYKGLAKEKEALEASFKVLSASKSDKVQPTPKPEDSEVSSDTQSETSNQSFTDPLNATDTQTTAKEESQDNGSSQNQIQTLSESLYTLTQEKSKLEASYLADKKRLMQENEEINSKLNEEREKNIQHCKTLENQIQELKSRIRSQQIEREKEQNDHALMLRELQKLLAQERGDKEQLENQLEDVSTALSEKEKLVPNVSEVYERKIQDLSKEMTNARSQLKAAVEKAKLPSAELIELQKDMEELKIQCVMQVQHEQKRANEAETKLTKIQREGEERVSSLESKLSDLSETLGDYERHKVQDQQAIQKLKERVTQLDLENSALDAAAQRDQHNMDNLENLETDEIAEKIVKLKGILKTANQTSKNPIPIQDLLCEEDGQCPLCKKLRDELEQVKEEFERYKLRAQSVLKNKSKDAGNAKEIDVLKSQVHEQREKLKNLHVQHQFELDKEKQKVENAHKTLFSVQEKHKNDMLQHEAEHQHHISELEIEIKKQRERTVSLLAEKDRDLDMLRASTHTGFYDTSAYYGQMRNPPASGASEEVSKSKSEEEQAVSRLLNMGKNEANLLFFSQQQARKEVEANALRKQKHDLESALRDLQLSSSAKEEDLQEKLEIVREQVRKCERDRAREGANLEYLKNVTYKFLTSFDPKAKPQMLNAITTILQFSPQEKSVVNTQFKGWWG